MVLANETLFVAGPPDLVDEVEALKKIDDPATQAKLVEHADSLAGKKGAMLWAVSATDGEKQAAYELEAPPVFDGMAAAAGRLYLSAENGSVVCFAGRQGPCRTIRMFSA